MRDTGIDTVGCVPWGTHFCQFYQTSDDLLDVLLPFFRRGLDSNEYCIWVTPDSLGLHEAQSALRKSIGAFDDRTRKGQIEIFDRSSCGIPSEGPLGESLVRDWIERKDLALKKGFMGLRVAGAYPLKGSNERGEYAKYESAINRTIRSHRMIALCSYPLDQCQPAEIAEIVHCHEFSVMRQDGKWQALGGGGTHQTLHETEQHYRLLFNGMSEGFALHEAITDESGTVVNYRFIDVNPAYEHLSGLRREDIVGRTVLEVTPNTESYWIRTYGDVAMTGQPAHVESYSAKLNRHYRVFVYSPIRGQFATLFLDFTEQRKAQELLEQTNLDLERRVERRTRQLLAANESLQHEISEHGEAERRATLTNTLLELFARNSTRKEYLDSLLAVIREWSQCRCVGIRLVDPRGNIPYESYTGFTREFWEKESCLSLANDQCVCTRVIGRKTERDEQPAVSAHGSFFTGDAAKFIAELPPKSPTEFRGQCIRDGFRTLGVIPILYQSTVLGAIHLADERANMASPATVRFLEYMTPLVGEAINRFNYKEALREQAALLDLAHEAIIVSDLENRIVFWNQGAERMYGWTRDEAVGQISDTLLKTEAPWSPAEILAKVTSESQWQGELVHIRKDGGRTHVDSHWVLQRDKENRPVGILHVSRDITQQKMAEMELKRHREHLEDMVRERTAQLQAEIVEHKQTEERLGQTATELQRSNKDLEQFAYVASHDLQEPLRAIAAYLQLLQRRYKGKIDSDADEFITFAVDGASRMKNLIIDLLAYARVGARGKGIRPASALTALENALAGLRRVANANNARISHDALPIVMADDIQLTQLFQNLIGNAIKFRRETPPEIHVGVREQPDAWLFSVRDNGIGVEPEFAHRIFEIFQRLHGVERYTGTGIGLAVCKRIVEHHGGRIWVEPNSDQGSSFYFTLPRTEASFESGTVWKGDQAE